MGEKERKSTQSEGFYFKSVYEIWRGRDAGGETKKKMCFHILKTNFPTHQVESF